MGNLCLTTFIMAIFGIGSFVISIDAFMLVYPLEYLVIVLKRLSAIAVHMYQIDHVHDENKHNVSQSELFSSIMQSMTDIFYSGKREKLFIDVLEKNEENVPEDDDDDDNDDDDDQTEEIKESNIECIEIGPVTIASNICLPKE